MKKTSNLINTMVLASKIMIFKKFLIFVIFLIFLEPPCLGGGGSVLAAHLLSGQHGRADVDGLADLTGLTALAVLVDLK